MYELYKELNRKLDEVIGKQERTMSLVSLNQNSMVPPGQAPPPPQPGADTIRRHDVDGVIQNQNQILTVAMELK